MVHMINITPAKHQEVSIVTVSMNFMHSCAEVQHYITFYITFMSVKLMNRDEISKGLGFSFLNIEACSVCCSVVFSNHSHWESVLIFY